MAYTQKNIKTTFLAVLVTNLFVLIINLAKKVVLYKGKNVVEDLLKQFLKSMIYCKK